MKNIYLFYGEEEFLMKEEIDALKKKHADPSNPFALEQVEGFSITADQLINVLNAAPMLGGSKVVLISNLFTDRKKTKGIMSQADVIINALKNILPDNIVIFQQVGNVDKRLKLTKYLEQNGIVKEFKPFAFWEQDKVVIWIVNAVKKEGKKIGSHAAEALIDIVGTNLRLLKKEVEKIVTFIGSRDNIDVHDVESLASSGEFDTFKLSNSVRGRDVKNALKSVSELFKDRQSPAMIVGMLAKLYRMLLQVKSLERRGMNQYEIAKMLGAKPFFVKKHMENTRLFTLMELKEGLGKLHFTDLKIKSGSNPRVELELLVSNLCKKSG